MTGSGRGRLVLGGVGLALTAYGGWLALSRGHDHLDLALWLGGGVVLHDGVLALIALGMGVAVMRLPQWVRGPIAAGLLVLGSVTLAAVPVLGRYGERADNPTLLPRDYTTGWLLLAGLVAVGVLIATLVVRSRRPSRPTPGKE